jgi:hypothetical protein
LHSWRLEGKSQALFKPVAVPDVLKPDVLRKARATQQKATRVAVKTCVNFIIGV